MARFGMVVDRGACVGCGACDIACKTENNTPLGIDWSFHEIKTSGVFPNINYEYIPKLCNHCEDAPCVAACPTGAMFKNEEFGITAHDSDLCIGCRACMVADPYDVIYFNDTQGHIEWTNDEALVAGATSSHKELADATQTPFPYINMERANDYSALRPQGIVEKCNFCSHITIHGEQPHCVVACPADARIFGDLDDEESYIAKTLKENEYEVLLKEKATKPKVFYIRSYQKEGRNRKS